MKDLIIDKNKIKLESERLRVRTLFPKDITKAYVDGLNDPAINQFLVARFTKHTRKIVTEYVSSNLKAKDAVLLGVFLKDSGRFIGTIRFSLWAYHFIANLGIVIFDKKMQGKGLALEALNRTATFIFKEMRFRCIESWAHYDNVPSMKLFKKGGFKVQSRLLNKYRHGNKFVNVYIFVKYNPKFDDHLLKDEKGTVYFTH